MKGLIWVCLVAVLFTIASLWAIGSVCEYAGW